MLGALFKLSYRQCQRYPQSNADVAEVTESRFTNISYLHGIVTFYISLLPVVSRLLSLTKLIHIGGCLIIQPFPTIILYHILGGLYMCVFLCCLLLLTTQKLTLTTLYRHAQLLKSLPTSLTNLNFNSFI